MRESGARRVELSRRGFLRFAAGATAVGVGGALPSPPYAWGTAAAVAAGPTRTILAYNENPFGMSAAARDAVLAAAESGNRYPKEAADGLRDDLARALEVDPKMIVLGAGSIE